MDAQHPLRLFCRFGHLVSTAFLSGAIILSYCFDAREVLTDQPAYPKLCTMAGVVLLMTGIANVFIIKSGKEKTSLMKVWIHFFSIKFMFTLMLTPAVKPIEHLFGMDEDQKLCMQFWIVLILIAYSGMIKAFREDVANNFEEDPFKDKFMQFQKKYKDVAT